jgi:MFS family permease
MVYPLLPLFLTRVIGAGPMSLGVIEGVAEAANSALKIVSGRLTDKWGAPKPLVLTGYGLSSAVRPLIALATSWVHVLALRFTDRLGKGVRTAPRDAMLASFAASHQRGRVFGFHRAMDHAGAVLGPLLASAFLFFYPGDYRTLFTLTLIPGAIVMLVLWRVPDARRERATFESADRVPGTHALPSSYYKALAVIVLFTLGNASDAFLLLRLSDLGVAAFWIPLLWAALHVVKMLASLGGGELSDRFGRRRIIALGWIAYALVYAGFGWFERPAIVIAIFLSYGFYFGLTEGVEKAWIADMAPASSRGIAFGLYNAGLGLGSLAASLLFGLLWTRISPEAAFFTGAGLALLATILLAALSAPSWPARA